MALQLSLWSGIIGLYLAIAGTLGALLRQVAGPARPAGDRILGTAYTLVLFGAASAFVLGLSDWAVGSRLALFGGGVAAAALAALRPAWVPTMVWRPSFGQRYLAGVMALAALWGINQALAGSATAPLTIAISAVAAGAASTGTSLRIPRLERSRPG